MHLESKPIRLSDPSAPEGSYAVRRVPGGLYIENCGFSADCDSRQLRVNRSLKPFNPVWCGKIVEIDKDGIVTHLRCPHAPQLVRANANLLPKVHK